MFEDCQITQVMTTYGFCPQVDNVTEKLDTVDNVNPSSLLEKIKEVSEDHIITVPDHLN